MSPGYLFSRAEDAHTIPQEADSCVNLRANRKRELLVEARREVAVAMGPLARVCRVGEAQVHPDRGPKPKPSQARPSQEEGSGWQVKRLKTGPQAQDQAQPKPSQPKPDQTKQTDLGH